MSDPAPSLMDKIFARMGAQRERLRQALGARAAEGLEFLLFGALALPWVFGLLRPGSVPCFGLAAGGVFLLGWLLLGLRGGDDDIQVRARNRGLMALCLAVGLAGYAACFVALFPKKSGIEEWVPPAGTVETQYGIAAPLPR